MNEAQRDRLMARLIRSAIQYEPDLIFDLISTRINRRSWTIEEAKTMNQLIDASDRTVSQFVEELL